VYTAAYNAVVFTHLLRNITCVRRMRCQKYITVATLSVLLCYIYIYILSRLDVSFCPLRKIDESATKCSSFSPHTAAGQQFFTFPRRRRRTYQRRSTSKPRPSDAREEVADYCVYRRDDRDYRKWRERGESTALFVHCSRNRSRNVRTVLPGETDSVPGQIYYWKIKNGFVKVIY